LVKAVAAERLAQLTGGVEPSLAYTAGLVHEIGKLAVAFTCGASFEAIRAEQVRTGGGWLEAEKAVLGFNHAEVSARLLTEWRFPAVCVAAAQHNPPVSPLPEDAAAMIAHVHAATYVASCLGVGQGEDGFLYAVNAELLATWGLKPTLIEGVLPEVVARCTHLLRDRLNTGAIKL
jgi:HD-like signal output (HDOD) protein